MKHLVALNHHVRPAVRPPEQDVLATSHRVCSDDRPGTLGFFDGTRLTERSTPVDAFSPTAPAVFGPEQWAIYRDQLLDPPESAAIESLRSPDSPAVTATFNFAARPRRRRDRAGVQPRCGLTGGSVEVEILRYTAFSGDPAGGNPAGIVLNATDLDDAAMQQIAADIGYSETAFLVPTGGNRASVRYFAPIAEVPFCGHATIASAVARAERVGTGPLTLDSPIGPIEISTSDTPDGITATLTSVPPLVTEIPDDVTGRLLAALRLDPADLDRALPIRVSYSGNHHPIVGVPMAVLESLDQDHDVLASLMAEQGWEATVAVVARIGEHEFETRNPFPPGGVREDPVTGSAAAALGGYLRALGLVEPPARVLVRQGRHIGRPGLVTVDVPAGDGGIAVTGRAVSIVDP